jgi:hypothetical protein
MGMTTTANSITAEIKRAVRDAGLADSITRVRSIARTGYWASTVVVATGADAEAVAVAVRTAPRGYKVIVDVNGRHAMLIISTDK